MVGFGSTSQHKAHFITLNVTRLGCVLTRPRGSRPDFSLFFSSSHSLPNLFLNSQASRNMYVTANTKQASSLGCVYLQTIGKHFQFILLLERKKNILCRWLFFLLLLFVWICCARRAFAINYMANGMDGSVSIFKTTSLLCRSQVAKERVMFS